MRINVDESLQISFQNLKLFEEMLANLINGEELSKLKCELKFLRESSAKIDLEKYLLLKKVERKIDSIEKRILEFSSGADAARKETLGKGGSLGALA